MRHSSGDIVLVEGNNELNVQLVPIAAEFYWLLPSQCNDPQNRWDNEDCAIDGWTDTRAETVGVSPKSWSPPLEFYIPATEVSAVRWWFGSPIWPDVIEVDIQYQVGGWSRLYEDGSMRRWPDGMALPGGPQIVTGARVRFFNRSSSVPMKFRVNEFQFFGYAEEPPEPREPCPGPPTTRLFGYVTDAVTGQPIAGATGKVYQDYDTKTKDWDIVTDGNGYYELRDMIVDADLTQMVLYASGYQDYVKLSIDIREGDNQLNIQMVPE